jgi:ornithine cyclodeaminase/alanine dehydrogenase-like protein (mu-crystallin family)
MKEDKGLLIVGSADVKRALSMSDCIDAVDKAMRALSSGGADVPLRTVMKLPGGRNFFGVMPGYLSEPQGLGTKIITIFPDNAKLGLSSHVGLVLLFDSEIGFPLAVMDAGEVTAIRTAAASAVATRALARPDAAHLAIIGTGEQAITHLEAIARVRTLKSVRVWGRSPDKAAAFAREQGARLGLAIEVSSSVKAAVEAADVVCTVTSSREPILHGAWLQNGTHVNLVGASQQTSREADNEVVAVSRFFVDSRVSARAEAGELKHAIAAGLVTESHVLGEIGEVLNGKVIGRVSSDDITVYKSLGVAAQDMAAARVIYDRAVRDSIGMRVPFYGH